jgi:hypothetical protein
VAATTVSALYSEWSCVDGTAASQPCAGSTAQWRGLGCEAGSVASINFGSNGDPALTGGTLPGSIGDLTALTHISFAASAVTGAVPSSVGSISKLQLLRLSQNSLIGSLPTSIGCLKHLKELNVGANSLTGSLPSSLADLGRLTALNLEQNSLSGYLPPVCSVDMDTVSLNASGLRCYPSCMSSVPHLAAGTVLQGCPYGDTRGLCGMLAATNIKAWYCNPNGELPGSIFPCDAEWLGLSCANGAISVINGAGIGLTGTSICVSVCLFI